MCVFERSAGPSNKKEFSSVQLLVVVVVAGADPEETYVSPAKKIFIFCLIDIPRPLSADMEVLVVVVVHQNAFGLNWSRIISCSCYNSARVCVCVLKCNFFNRNYPKNIEIIIHLNVMQQQKQLHSEYL